MHTEDTNSNSSTDIFFYAAVGAYGSAKGAGSITFFLNNHFWFFSCCGFFLWAGGSNNERPGTDHLI